MNKGFILALSAVAALALKADVMNWQVADDSLADCTDAKLYYVNSDAIVGGEVLASSELDEGYGDVVQIDLSTIGAISPSTTYFYIEVGNYKDGNFIAKQGMGAYSYSDLVSAGLISTGGLSTPTGNSFGQAGVEIGTGGASAYSQVPEPGTATLILLGMAIAGLKRRRV